jgi:hypothetical protein
VDYILVHSAAKILHVSGGKKAALGGSGNFVKLGPQLRVKYLETKPSPRWE